MTIETMDGERHSAMVPNPVGDSEYEPFSTARLHCKFRSLVMETLGPDRTERAIDLIAGIDRLPDVRALTEELA